MTAISSLCVFCGSSPGLNPQYAQAAQHLGRLLADEKITLIYGGASVGLMGLLADAALSAGGRVAGVIPSFLQSREIAHPGLSELIVVNSMHARKAKMAELADGFIAMPGGLGALEEFCEVLTHAQLGLHRKPCGLLNVDGFHDPLIAFMETMVGCGFVRPRHRGLVLSAGEPGRLLRAMQAFDPGQNSI